MCLVHFRFFTLASILCPHPLAFSQFLFSVLLVVSSSFLAQILGTWNKNLGQESYGMRMPSLQKAQKCAFAKMRSTREENLNLVTLSRHAVLQNKSLAKRDRSGMKDRKDPTGVLLSAIFNRPYHPNPRLQRRISASSAGFEPDVLFVKS